MTWYEAFDEEVADEVEGDDFLNTTVVSNTQTHEIKLKVHNVFSHFGPDKPIRGTEEYRQMLVDEYTIVLEHAAALTKNTICHSAMPVDLATIRNYDLVAKEYKLPGFQVNDSSTLMSTFIEIVKEATEVFIEEEKKAYEKAHGAGTYMPKANFETKIQPLLGEVIRFNIKYWMLHPWLTRIAAHDAAMAHIQKNFKKKGDCKKMIDELLFERKTFLLKKEIFALTPIQAPGDNPEGREVFNDNESAQLLMTKFLKHHKYPMSKESLDVLEDMNAYIGDLDPDEQAQFGMFLNIVPRETEAYREKQRKAAEKAERELRKKREKEARESQKNEKKQKTIEKLQKELEDAAKAETEAATASTEAEADTEADPKEKPPTKVLDLTQTFVEFKCRYASVSTVEQDISYYEKNTKSEAKQLALSMGAGIRKTFVKFRRNAVEVQYTKPGALWTHAVDARFGNLVNVINCFSLKNRNVMRDCLRDGANEISEDSGRVVMAIMLHAGAKDEKEINEVSLHASFWEENFIADLKNTKALWLPVLHEGCLIHLYGLYQLVCDDARKGGLKKKERRAALTDILEDRTVCTTDVGQQVTQMIRILVRIDNEIVSDEIGSSAAPTDPFDTTSLVFEESKKESKKTTSSKTRKKMV